MQTDNENTTVIQDDIKPAVQNEADFGNPNNNLSNASGETGFPAEEKKVYSGKGKDKILWLGIFILISSIVVVILKLFYF